MSAQNQFTEKQVRLLDLLAQHYFYATELQAAHSIFEREGYEQAIRYLVNEGRASARSVGGGIHPMLNYATQGDHIVAWEPGGNAAYNGRRAGLPPDGAMGKGGRHDRRSLMFSYHQGRNHWLFGMRVENPFKIGELSWNHSRRYEANSNE